MMRAAIRILWDEFDRLCALEEAGWLETKTNPDPALVDQMAALDVERHEIADALDVLCPLGWGMSFAEAANRLLTKREFEP